MVITEYQNKARLIKMLIKFNLLAPNNIKFYVYFKNQTCSHTEMEVALDPCAHCAGHWLSEVGKERMIQKGKPVAALSAAFQLLA